MLALRRRGLGDGEGDFNGVWESAPDVGGGSFQLPTEFDMSGVTITPIPSGGSVTVPGGSSNNWGSFLQNIVKQWSTAGASRLAAPSVVRGADGSLVLRNSPQPNYTGVGVSSNIPGWVWLAGGVGLVAVIAMNKKGGR